MRTIEIKTGEQTAQFTTKSVTFDSREFFYSKMSDVKHMSDEKAYSFTYEGQLKTLPYEEKDFKVLNAIFSQVMNMQPQNPANSNTETSHQTPQVTETSSLASETSGNAAQETSEQSSDAENDSENISDTEEKIVPDSAQTKEHPKDKKAAKKAERERKKAEKVSIKAEKKIENSEGSHNADPDIKGKRKKSIITFAIITGVVALMAVAYYFIFGTSDNPSSGPNSTESQQYEDIDQLIDDLQ